MATDRYSEATEDIVELMAVDAFLNGCNDKKAAIAAMDKNPSRIDQALQCAKSSIHNQKVLFGNAKPQLRKVQHVTFESDESSDNDPGKPTVRVLKRKPFKSPTQEMFEDRLELTENDVSNMQKDISKMLSLLSRNQYNGRSRTGVQMLLMSRSVTL